LIKVSGGGGWGAKQGLLSLDPQTTYDAIPEARYDYSEGTLEEQQASALGKIAQEGDSIQFFVAHTRKYHDASKLSGKAKGQLRKSIVFGAIPSTIDDIPGPQNTDGTALDPNIKPLHIRVGHFGYVSESGMFLHYGPQKNKGSKEPVSVESYTKIDLPYSYLYKDFEAEKSPPSGLIRRLEVTRLARKVYA